MTMFRNRIVSLAHLLGLLVLVMASSQGAQAVYTTQFEDPSFVADLPLVGQDGWICPALFSPNAAMISTAKPRQGKQSVRVAGADLVESQDVFDLTGFYQELSALRVAFPDAFLGVRCNNSALTTLFPLS